MGFAFQDGSWIAEMTEKYFQNSYWHLKLWVEEKNFWKKEWKNSNLEAKQHQGKHWKVFFWGETTNWMLERWCGFWWECQGLGSTGKIINGG